ncbi:MAG TPA: hypothetical protein VNY74_11430 [Edaphobacter sp.]|jgi:hypothetical protein|nr:hypothetical protein [Edaphobacter sp.]
MARTIVLAALLLAVAAPPPCRSQSLPGLPGDSGAGATAPSYAASLKPEHPVLPPDVSPPDEKTSAVAASPVATIPAAIRPPQPALIVVGFAGGYVRRNSTVHGEVQLAEHLRNTYGSTIHAEIFENHHGREAHREILRLVGASAGDASTGAMTEAAKRAARIILYGHSWGASEAVAMARQLERDGVPVLLLVQVDGVPKLGEDDAVIPANVAQAVNFYQLDGLLHGRRRIRAADPAATTILGNFRLTYKDTGVACPGYPWYTRAFTKPHIEIENDPRVWNKVEALILSNLILSKATP